MSLGAGQSGKSHQSGSLHRDAMNVKTILVNGTDVESNLVPQCDDDDAGKFLKTDGTSVAWADLPATPNALSVVNLGLPSQSGETNKYLKTNSTGLEWDAPLPPQSGETNKFLKTDGTKAEWEHVNQVPAYVAADNNKFLKTDGLAVGWAEPLPSGGTTGQVLTKTATGYEWADASGGGDVMPYILADLTTDLSAPNNANTAYRLVALNGTALSGPTGSAPSLSSNQITMGTAGVYEVVAQLIGEWANYDGYNQWVAIYKNSDVLAEGGANTGDSDGTFDMYSYSSRASVLVTLSATDTLELRVLCAGTNMVMRGRGDIVQGNPGDGGPRTYLYAKRIA